MGSKQKIRVGVLMGGPSAEHEISLKTGEQVLENIDRKKYEAEAVNIGKGGKWPISFADFKKRFDVAFIALHGEYGEDGTVQKLLEKEKIRFTGSDSKASKLGMDKTKSSSIFQKIGLTTPRFSVLRNGNGFLFDFPAVVKPVDRGSSVGMSIVENIRDLAYAVELAQKYSLNVMIEEYIRGKELTCGILEINGKPKAMIPTEILPQKAKFFDFEAKYEPGASLELTPPKLFKDQIQKIQEMAIAAHKAIGARGFSRTDMILRNDENIYVLEINTVPGMTETSLFPQGAKAAGIGFSKTLDYIIEAALR